MAKGSHGIDLTASARSFNERDFSRMTPENIGIANLPTDGCFTGMQLRQQLAA